MSSNECTPSERLQQLCQDQRARWLRGDRVFVESFFDEHPELRIIDVELWNPFG